MTDKLRAASEAALYILDDLNRDYERESWRGAFDAEVAALRAALAEQEVQSTHSAECYKWHHECAKAEVERLRAALAEHENEDWSNCTASQRMNPHFTNTINPIDFPKSKYTTPPRRE